MKFSRILLVVLLLTCILNGCINQKHNGPLTYFKNFSLVFEGFPLLNTPVNLVCTVEERDFASDIIIEFLLPEGFELVDGTLKWEGHADPYQTATHTITIKAVKLGKWVVSAWAGPSYRPHYDSKSLYVTITETSAEVSTRPFNPQETDGCTGSLSYFGNFSISLSDFLRPIFHFLSF